MKGRFRFWLAGALALAAGTAAEGQIDIQWKPEHSRVVLLAPIDAEIRIDNQTGRDWTLGPGGDAELSFRIEGQDGMLVRPEGRGLVRERVVLENGATTAFRVNILDGYVPARPESYMLSPVLELGDGAGRFGGARISLEIQPGLEVARREYGLASAGTDRAATLRVIHRGREDIVFFRLDGPSAGLCYGVHELGSIIRYFRPQIEWDGRSVCHVLFQTAPDRFLHARFGMRGEPYPKEIYMAQVGSIRLARDGGQVVVAGGTRFEEDPEAEGVLTAPNLPPVVKDRGLGDTPLTPKALDKKHFWQE